MGIGFFIVYQTAYTCRYEALSIDQRLQKEYSIQTNEFIQ
jgi:hypothetical protein